MNIGALRDAPIGFWEDVESEGILSADGVLNAQGMSGSISLIWCVARLGDPDITKDEIRRIPTSEIGKVLEVIEGLMSNDTREPGDGLRPTSGSASTSATPSLHTTDGPATTSAG